MAAAPDEEETGSSQTVVTATRFARPLRDVPSSVVVIPREEIERSPALTLDNLVRAVPSVATFRRSSSWVADPSSQGLNLRGVGPSGVSRALVLLDGVPVNDPFGGWVYWRSIPQLGLGRVEVVPGGGSALYGSAALGGVVQLFSRPIAQSAVEGTLAAGNLRTGLLAARVAHRGEHWRADVEGEGLTSAGYPLLVPAQRGDIDWLAAPSHHATLNARVVVDAAPGLTLDARAGVFGEDQSGGTTFTTARVRTAHGTVGARVEGEHGVTRVQLFRRAVRFSQTRARVAPGRSAESLAVDQDVPAAETGSAVTWAGPPWRAWGEHALAAGIDLRQVSGASDETLFPPASAVTAPVRRVAGGDQFFVGAFVQDLYAPTGWLTLSATARVDTWLNASGRVRLERASGAQESEAFAARTETAFSPRLGALVRATDWLAFRGSAYRAFRAPTLNELYRPFQVGTVLTAANAALRAESLVGGELGVELAPLPAWVVRAIAFWNGLQDPITNVTLEAPLPNGAQRQRENLGRARVRGAELFAEWRLSPGWSALLGYTYVDARVTRAPGLPALLGKRLVQAPEHRGTAALVFVQPGWFSALVQVRATGAQYEDDLNRVPLESVWRVDGSLRRTLLGGLEGFVAVENLLDRQYRVGSAGVDTLGPPRTFRVGLALRELPRRSPGR